MVLNNLDVAFISLARNLPGGVVLASAAVGYALFQMWAADWRKDDLPPFLKALE